MSLLYVKGYMKMSASTSSAAQPCCPCAAVRNEPTLYKAFKFASGDLVLRHVYGTVLLMNTVAHLGSGWRHWLITDRKWEKDILQEARDFITKLLPIMQHLSKRICITYAEELVCDDVVKRKCPCQPENQACPCAEYRKNVGLVTGQF